MTQIGGLSLRNPEKYAEISSNEEKYAAAMDEMIKNAILIECISYESFSGFIFIVKVNEEYAVFNSLDENSTFTKPVTVILLKIVMLTNYEYTKHTTTHITYMSINSKKYKKSIVNKNDIIFELEDQYNIYKKTLSYNNVPICPSIIYNSILSATKQTKSYLSKLNKKIKELYGDNINTASTVIQILIDVYNNTKNLYDIKNNKLPPPDLGIIGMEFAEGYDKFITYLNQHIYTKENHDDVKNDVLILHNCDTHCRTFSSIIVNIIRLFISTGIIHVDLHVENIMVNTNLQKSLLIDFGIVDNIITNYTLFKNMKIYNDEYIFKTLKNNQYVVSLEALKTYLYSQFGTSYKYIGKGEQIFMQDYLYNISDVDTRCKKILKLFLLIVISERQINFKNVSGFPMNSMRILLNALGLQITSTFTYGNNLAYDKYIFDYEILNNDNITFEAWINDENNIKPSYKLFFKNIFLQVYETLNEYYKFQNFETVNTSYVENPETDVQNPETVFNVTGKFSEPVVRIGLDPDESNKYNEEAKKYSYKISAGRNKIKNTRKRKSTSAIRKHKKKTSRKSNTTSVKL